MSSTLTLPSLRKAFFKAARSFSGGAACISIGETVSGRTPFESVISFQLASSVVASAGASVVCSAVAAV
eukprot:10137689-Prorocentrum_lima.AAC.1